MDPIRSEWCQRRQQFARSHFEIRSSVNAKSNRLKRSTIDVENGARVVQFVLMLLHVRPRAIGELFFPRKENKSNGVLWPNPESLKNARGFQNNGDSGAIIIGALRGIPIVEMRR